MKVMEGTVLFIEATKVGEVYFKLAKYMLIVKLVLAFVKRENCKSFPFLTKTKNFVSFCFMLKHMDCPSYPRRESTNISRNNTIVSFGLAFLQENENHIK
jgi:hypothetical protein